MKQLERCNAERVDWSLIYDLVDRVATEVKQTPDGKLDRDEFTNFVKGISDSDRQSRGFLMKED